MAGLIHSLVNMKEVLQNICSEIFYILISGKLMIMKDNRFNLDYEMYQASSAYFFIFKYAFSKYS